MFQCDVRQKMLFLHKGEDYPSNLIVYLIECIEIAHKTECPIENLKSIGLIFYTDFFVINFKLLSTVLIIPSSHLKKLLIYHQCSIIKDLKLLSQNKEVLDTKKWEFYKYSITNDSKNLLSVLSKYHIFIDQYDIYKENQILKNYICYTDFGIGFTPLSLPNILPISSQAPSHFSDNQSKVFISNNSMHHIESNNSLDLEPVQLCTCSYWPYLNSKPSGQKE